MVVSIAQTDTIELSDIQLNNLPCRDNRMVSFDDGPIY